MLKLKSFCSSTSWEEFRKRMNINVKKILDVVEYRKTFSYDDFVKEYNSLKGNAFGISNTLLQTAFLRPRMQSLKVNNLFYAGQSTVPGGGIPPCIISGEMVAKLITEKYDEVTITTLPSRLNTVLASIPLFSRINKMMANIYNTIDSISAKLTATVMKFVNPSIRF